MLMLSRLFSTHQRKPFHLPRTILDAYGLCPIETKLKVHPCRASCKQRSFLPLYRVLTKTVSLFFEGYDHFLVSQALLPAVLIVSVGPSPTSHRDLDLGMGITV